MVDIDRSDMKSLIQELRDEKSGYNKQWMSWLGAASGGGALTLLTFATKLPDTDYALRELLLPLSAFIGGIIFAGAAVLTAALRVAGSGEHYAAAFNRDELDDAIGKIPEILSSPKRLADEANASRNALIKKREHYHSDSEGAWRRQLVWKWLNRVCLAGAAALFLIGVVAPLVHVASGKSYAIAVHQ